MPSSPLCEVQLNGGSWVSAIDGINAAAGDAVVIRLADDSGADAWDIQITATDELAPVVVTTFDSILKLLSFTAPVEGSALILTSKTKTNGESTWYKTTIGIFVPTVTGGRAIAKGQMLEGSSEWGWLPFINPLMRNAGGALPTWASVYEIDFSAEATQAFTADGSVLIDGKTWTVANKAAATTFGITNGSGLIIGPSTSNTEYSGANRTCPIITIPVSSLLSSFDLFAHELRLTVYLSAINGDANTELARAGFEVTSAPTNQNVMVAKGFGLGAVTIRSVFNLAGVATLVDDATNNSDNVLSLYYSPKALRAETRSGVYSGGFPATTRGRRFMSLGGAVASYPATSTDLRVLLAAQSGNVSGNFSVTIHSMKLEALYT